MQIAMINFRVSDIFKSGGAVGHGVHNREKISFFKEGFGKLAYA